MRKVTFTLEHFQHPDPHPLDGYFHCWGYSSYEDRGTHIMFSIAIVEDICGKIYTLLPEQIKFIEPIK